MITMKDFLMYLVKNGGSDIHLCAGRKPHIRIHGELLNTKFDALRPEDVKSVIEGILTKEQLQFLNKNKELDVSYMMPEVCRFRFNIYLQRGSLGVVVRAIPFQVESFDILRIPPTVKRFVENMHGLVLVTGPQGSGKTTTLAAIVDYINSTRKANILTIEDPIEYHHPSKKSVVNQREVGRDTDSYTSAMKYVLRQDLDVCLVGEMRDRESVKTALELAEAGVFVLSTVHASSASKTISRVIDMFPPDYQNTMRTQISLVLKAVVSQQLIPKKDGKGRILACEVMKMTNSIENMIKSYSIKQIDTAIQTGRDEGMQTMDQALFDLYQQGHISIYELNKRAADKSQVKKWLEQSEAA